MPLCITGLVLASTSTLMPYSEDEVGCSGDCCSIAAYGSHLKDQIMDLRVPSQLLGNLEGEK
jgi:hypothetical protein